MLRLCLSWLCLTAMFAATSAEDPKPTGKMSYARIRLLDAAPSWKGRL